MARALGVAVKGGLLPETLAQLRRHRVREPSFPNAGAAALFEQETTRGRFKVLPAERGHVVHDADAANGQGNRGEFLKLADAVARAQQSSDEATACGEENSIPKHGWGHDWANPKTWERWW